MAFGRNTHFFYVKVNSVMRRLSSCSPMNVLFYAEWRSLFRRCFSCSSCQRYSHLQIWTTNPHFQRSGELDNEATLVLLSSVWVFALRRMEKSVQMMLQLLTWKFGHHFHELFVSDSHVIAVWALPEKSFQGCVSHRRVGVRAQALAHVN